jgi:alpha-tubulin suppressor-like RCC1 family protein
MFFHHIAIGTLILFHRNTTQMTSAKITAAFRSPINSIVHGAILWILAFVAHAVPQLVTPQLPPGIQGEAYSASLMIGSVLPLSSATVTGLPAGLSATHNGSGSIAIAGTPTVSGNITLAVIAADNAANTLNSSVTLSIGQVSNSATAVSTGGRHSCAIVKGGVQCWGNNENGQLGDNSVASSVISVQVLAAGSKVTSIAAADVHTCAVVNGGVKCWGDNAYGQLGNDSLVRSLVPVQAIVANSRVTAVSASSDHTCAVVDGGVQCWGNNSFAQLGNNSTVQSTIPVQIIPAGSNVTSIAAGGSQAGGAHTCAVVSGGVQCWGYNAYGQLGIGTHNGNPVPAQAILAGSNVTEVTAGGFHTCAIANGGVQCWGDNSQGQLGNGTTTGSPLPVQAIAVGSNVTSVSAGSFMSCAVVNGGAQCWGDNSAGRLGNGNLTRSLVPVQAIAAGSNVTAVAAAGGFVVGIHACAVAGGRVKCWGYNSDGQLGNYSATKSNFPVQSISPSNTVTAVAAGLAHSCAVVSGGLQCWGYNGDGQLGNGNTVQSLVPVQTIAPNNLVTAVSVGEVHSCAVVDAGVKCWGDNQFGKLGNSSTVQSLVPLQIIAAGSRVTGVAAGGAHTCAVVNGGVQCWGYNAYGQLGINSTTDSAIPVQAIPADSNVTAVAAGLYHSCAVLSGGVQCWGDSRFGALGVSATQNLVPVQIIAAGSGATAVAAGTYHACAAVNGGVQCWGLNSNGQLGNGGTGDSTTTPVEAIAVGGNITVLAAGGFHTCAIASGGAKCWGSNLFGQLGDNSEPSLSFTPRDAIVAGSNVNAVAAGFYHSCAVVSGGLACWGYNAFGQLANAYNGPAWQPDKSLILLETFPGVPRIGTESSGNGLATINFTPPLSNGSAPILGYSATCVPGAISASGIASPITVTGLTNDESYTCSVVARNAAGVGPASASVGVMPSASILFALVGVQSRKFHGNAGAHDLSVDTTQSIGGLVTVEPRTIGAGHTIAFQFNGPVNASGTVGVAPIGSAVAAFSGNEVLVTLANIPDNQRVTLALANVNGSLNLPPVSIGFLIGDVNNSRSVNTSDIIGVKVRAGQTTDTTNFQFDLNASGMIDAADISAVKARSGMTLP